MIFFECFQRTGKLQFLVHKANTIQKGTCACKKFYVRENKHNPKFDKKNFSHLNNKYPKTEIKMENTEGFLYQLNLSRCLIVKRTLELLTMLKIESHKILERKILITNFMRRKYI